MARKTLRTSYISTVVSIALVLFMIGTLGVLVLHANRLSNYLKENIQLTVTLLPEAKDADVTRLGKTMGNSPFVRQVTCVTKDSAAAQLQRELGVTSVAVTHDMKSAYKIADRIVMLHHGKIIADGDADYIRNHSDAVVQQFIRGEFAALPVFKCCLQIFSCKHL